MKKNVAKISRVLITLLIVVTFLVLINSVFKSGYNYVFDSDEYLHSQIAYLIFSGYKPFINLYTSWIPIFHWLLVPVLALNNFSFDSLLLARIFMIILFVIRIILGFLLVKKLFGKIVAILFVFLLLLDPFTVFTAMQIRPDNLMVTLFTLGLLVFTYAIYNSSKLLLFYSGFIFALSIATCLKIAPGIMAVILCFFVYVLVNRRNLLKGVVFFLGMFFAAALTVVYFLTQNSLSQMIQQVTTDAATLHNSIWNFTGLGYFYAQGNEFLYGLPGKPINWIYVWILPILAFMGVFRTVQKFFIEPNDGRKSKIILIILVVSFIFQWFALFFYHSVFIQYYIPISWFYALFSAVIIGYLDKITRDFTVINLLYRICLFILISSLIFTSIKANNQRSIIYSTQGQKQILSSRWVKIPKNSFVFPNLLFRPIADPFLSLFYFIPGLPKSITDRYAPLLKTLKTYNVSYLLISDHVMYYYVLPDQELKAYIDNNFVQDQADKELWIKR
jgi:4-amino-4-deoxy-L-arabinose transferase-like glycosyltransferase